MWCTNNCVGPIAAAVGSISHNFTRSQVNELDVTLHSNENYI
jgi:hypothetical protein